MSNADQGAQGRESGGAQMRPEHANVEPSIVRESGGAGGAAPAGAHVDPSGATNAEGTGSGSSSTVAGTETPAG